MADNQETSRIKIDLSGPSLAADCLDAVVAFPVAVDRMRASDDELELPRAMIAGMQVAFDTLDGSSGEDILIAAAAGQDQLYRHIAGIAIMDRFTRAYCSLVMRSFFEKLSERRVRTFYILDNALREDRLAAILELFSLAGISTVTPKRDGTAWPALSARIRAGLETVGHVAYIEPDAEVNHLEAAQEITRESVCVASFRNLAPEHPQYSIVAFRSS